jgi:hypothetical protein
VPPEWSLGAPSDRSPWPAARSSNGRIVELDLNIDPEKLASVSVS